MQLHRTLRLSLAVSLAGAFFAAHGNADAPVAPAEAASTSGETKPEPNPIYDPDADGKELIAAALKRAKLEGKHVLIEWGGNWCGWCHKLHDVFQGDKVVHPIVAGEFELVLVDSSSNRELMKSYGGKDTRFAFPYLTILDVDGKVLTNQETGSLETGPKHDPQAVAKFLKKWKPAINAEELLATALRQAASENKRVLLHVGTPTSGWCKILTNFLSEHEAILSHDFIDLRLDTVRMQHGEEVASRFLPAESVGVPWIVILDDKGQVLATSVGPMGNCGYPGEPAEIDHFLLMLKRTKQRLDDDGLQKLRTDLDAFRIERKRGRSNACE